MDKLDKLIDDIKLKLRPKTYPLLLVIVPPVFISLEKVRPSISVLQSTAKIVRKSFPVPGYWLWVGIINSFWVKPPVLRTFKMYQVSCCLVF